MTLRRRAASAVLAATLAGAGVLSAAPAAHAGPSGRSGVISWETGRWQGERTIFVTNHGRRAHRVRCEWARYYSDTFRLRPGRTHRVFALASTRRLQCGVLR